MRLRRRILQALVLSVVVGWFLFGGIPILIFMYAKDDIVFSLEQDGIDVSECKKRKLSILNPTAGMPGCLTNSYNDVARRFEQQIENAEKLGDEDTDEMPTSE